MCDFICSMNCVEQRVEKWLSRLSFTHTYLLATPATIGHFQILVLCTVSDPMKTGKIKWKEARQLKKIMYSKIWLTLCVLQVWEQRLCGTALSRGLWECWQSQTSLRSCRCTTPRPRLPWRSWRSTSWTHGEVSA